MQNLTLIENKIFDFRAKESKIELKRVLSYLNYKGLEVGFTNGCFDILHLGHIEYLAKAADKCNFMILGLNTDKSIRKIKGESRPINDEKARASVMASLRFVDMVVFFDQETPHDLINFICPKKLFKGNDYKVEEIVGFDIVKKNGGIVETIELTEGYSTTKIEQKIISYVKK